MTATQRGAIAYGRDSSVGGVHQVMRQHGGCRSGYRTAVVGLAVTSDYLTFVLEHSPLVFEYHRINTIFEKPSEKNLKVYIINICAKTPETL
jgi:hypothetical protein